MLNNDKEKETQINQILNLVKISSLSFPAIAFMQYFSNHFNNNTMFFYKYGFLFITIFSIMLFVFLLWTILQIKVSESINKWIDPIIALAIAFLSVMLTGAYESSYKYLFLFVIIYSSIECDIKASMTISGLSAAIILIIDLVFAPKKAVNTYFESDIVLACAFLIIAWTIGYYVNLRKKHIEQLNNLASIDGLTGLYNHRFFYENLSKQIEISKNDNTDLSLLFIDIDNFKYYNDMYGHLQGDEILRTIAVIMNQTISKDAFITRYGGEEFAILLPKTIEIEAVKQAEKLRNAIQEYEFSGQENLPGGNLTISIGVSTFPSKAKTEDELLKRSDEACYRAKFLSKNRVEAYYSILEELQNKVSDIDHETIASIKTLIAVINAKDKYTYGHVERVVFYCTLLAEKMSLNDKDKENLIYSAYLHDIGKINIPEEILIKTDPLTNEEWEILKRHPQNAVEIIKNITPLNDLMPIILQHHEKYDGTGYPCKLKGNDINYLARMLAIVDSFDAMTSIRPYQQKKSYSQAINELLRCSGTQFDPEIVNVFISAIREKYEILS